MSRRGEHGFDGNNDRRTCRGGAANENKTRRAPLCLLLPGPDIGPVGSPSSQQLCGSGSDHGFTVRLAKSMTWALGREFSLFGWRWRAKQISLNDQRVRPGAQ
jgi:hypothetical protein